MLLATRTAANSSNAPLAASSAVTDRKQAHHNESASMIPPVTITSLSRPARFQTPRPAPGSHLSRPAAKRSSSTRVRPYTCTMLPSAATIGNVKQPRKCSWPLARSTPRRCKRPRTSESRSRAFTGNTLPIDRSENPTPNMASASTSANRCRSNHEAASGDTLNVWR